MSPGLRKELGITRLASSSGPMRSVNVLRSVACWFSGARQNQLMPCYRFQATLRATMSRIVLSVLGKTPTGLVGPVS